MQVYVVRSYTSKTLPLYKRNNDNNKGDDKSNKHNDLIRILTQKQNSTIENSKNSDSSNTPTGVGSSSSNTPSSTTDSGDSGSGKKTFHCPKCGALCTHVDSLVSLSRFVKCEKCNHFFVIMAEDRKPLNVSRFFSEKQQQQQQPQPKQFKPTPPPPPKKIYEYLDKYIIGQEHSKKVISVAVYNHYKRINNNMSQAAASQANKQQNQQQQTQTSSTIPEILSGV